MKTVVSAWSALAPTQSIEMKSETVSFIRISLRLAPPTSSAVRGLPSNREFFSTLDKLAAAENCSLRRGDRVRADRRDLVLRHAEIYPRRLSADPAGSVSARHPCLAARDGLPLLPQLCRRGGAFEFAEHAGLHELPHAGAEGQPETRAGARELEKR